MGKYILLVVAAVMAGSSMLMYQSQKTSLDTDQRQAQRQEKLIARQIARTGYNAVLAEARIHEDLDKKAEAIVTDVGTMTGDYQGGTYEAWLEKISPTSYRAVSVGRLESSVSTIGTGGSAMISHRIEEQHRKNTIPEASQPQVPTEGSLEEVADSSRLEIEFIDSMAGYCSAIFLQRMQPKAKNNNGHGNNCDGVDSSNPGKGNNHWEDPSVDSDPTDEVVDDDECKGGGRKPDKFREMETELVFAPGNNRNGAMSSYDRIIAPGTRLNFILAVDADNSCEDRGEAVTINDDSFDYVRSSFAEDVTQFGKINEAPYALMQEKPSQPGTWRIAFEDLIFDDERLWDIKQNGYPNHDSNNAWSNRDKTYGGNGWGTDSEGYARLKDYGNVPDFSDQVIEVKIIPISAESGDDQPPADG